VKVTIRKAITATGFTFAGALGTALLDGALTVPEVLASAGAALLAGAATWRVPYAVRTDR
jgi:hypothetical protein